VRTRGGYLGAAELEDDVRDVDLVAVDDQTIDRDQGRVEQSVLHGSGIRRGRSRDCRPYRDDPATASLIGGTYSARRRRVEERPAVERSGLDDGPHARPVRRLPT
jgi:hypothetical protein